MQDRIEQEIVINAPLDRVWDLVSVPGWWVPTAAETEPDRAPGHVTVRESERWGRFPVEVVEMRPPRYAAFRWASQAPGADLAPGHTTLVEFFVADAVGERHGIQERCGDRIAGEDGGRHIGTGEHGGARRHRFERRDAETLLV